MDGSGAGRWAVRTLALALAYSATARLGWLFATAQTGISPFWPPAGIALATLVLGGRSLWPGVFLGALAGDLSLGISWPLAVTGACANTIETVTAAWLLSRWPGFRPSLGGLRDLTALMTSGALASLLGATVGTIGLMLFMRVTRSRTARRSSTSTWTRGCSTPRRRW